MFEGVHTALVTPFTETGIDEACYRELIQSQIESGVQGIVPVGTTGESPTVNMDEHVRLVEIAVELAAGKTKVIAGTGANCAREAIHLTQAAERLGADASLQVAPYYNKPTQQGLFEHFRAVAESTQLPIVLYSIPGRCGVAIELDTVVRLREACSNIVAIKEAGGAPDRVSEFRNALGDSMEVLSGDDSLTLPFMSVGAIGVISVASNVIPSVMVDMVKKALAGDFVGARSIHERYFRFFRGMFLETNPIPIKTALVEMGRVPNIFRLPMTPPSDAHRVEIAEILKSLDLL